MSVLQECLSVATGVDGLMQGSITARSGIRRCVRNSQDQEAGWEN